MATGKSTLIELMRRLNVVPSGFLQGRPPAQALALSCPSLLSSPQSWPELHRQRQVPRPAIRRHRRRSRGLSEVSSAYASRYALDFPPGDRAGFHKLESLLVDKAHKRFIVGTRRGFRRLFRKPPPATKEFRISPRLPPPHLSATKQTPAPNARESRPPSFRTLHAAGPKPR